LDLLKGGEKMKEYKKDCFDYSEDAHLKHDMETLSRMMNLPLAHTILLEILLKLNELTEQQNKNEKADQE
jgi:hypothetical protein